MTSRIEKSIIIRSTAESIWESLTTPSQMRQWMGEPEMNIDVETDWEVNGPIIIRGFHHIAFKNTGIVLHFEPHRLLRYSHMSSTSRLKELSENHCILEFQLTPSKDLTELTLTISNFPTETIYRHMDFYWGTTLKLLKTFVENRDDN